MIPQILSFVDVETTGTSPSRDRIIDIGIVRVENGIITDTLNSLVDPQDHIPPEITRITGITTELLYNAPTFRSLKDKVDELLKDSVIVAHNSRFDTGFLKSEYARLGVNINLKQICTVKLSRIMYPRFRHHNLDSIVERFDLHCEPRHRAYPDAKVLWDFFQILMKHEKSDKFEEAIKTLLKRPSIPKGISSKIVDRLPETPGVYIFYGNNGSPLYVGKSVNIKSRVLSHFYDSQKVSKEFLISEQTKHIDYIQTEGELGALLKEKKLIAELKPIYNRKLREIKTMPVAILSTNKYGYNCLKIKNSKDLEHSDIQNILSVFKSQGDLKRSLSIKAKDYKLCKKLLCLENSKGACFGVQIEACNGACINEEKPIKYNLRFLEAFMNSKVKVWPFKGPIVIPEGEIGHVIYMWCYLGLINNDKFEEIDVPINKMQFDWDIYKILSNYLLKPDSFKRIKNYPLSLAV